VFTLPDTPLGASIYGVEGTIRLADRAPDDVIDRVLGRPGAADGGVTATSSSRLPGSPASRAAGALDGDPGTAWVPALGPQVGQFVRYDFARPVTTEHLDLQVIADERHSIPSRLRLTNQDGDEVVVGVPRIEREAALGAIGAARVLIPDGFDFEVLRVTIEATDPAITTDYFARSPVELPVGIAELGLSGGEVVAPTPDDIDAGCRRGLVTVDGIDSPISLSGTTAAAEAREPIDFVACGEPLRLAEGEHTASTTPGRETGLDVDRLVIDRILLGGVVVAEEVSDAGPPVRATRTSRSSFDLVLRGVDDPFFVVLGESYSDAWDASTDSDVSISPPIRLNGFGTGWFVDPSAVAADAEPVEVTLRWIPQRWATFAQRFSLAGVAICIVLLLVGRRTSEVEVADAPAALARVPTLVLDWDHPSRAIELVPTVTVSLIAGLLSAFFIDPLAGPLVASLGIVLGLRPSLRSLLPIGAAVSIAISGALTVAFQIWKEYPPGFSWASSFESLHPLGWVAIALLALNTTLEVVAARSAPPREVRKT
jgi:arabinofuranan 3-O-arabinosyltransferase